MEFIDQYADVIGSGVKEKKGEEEVCNLSDVENFIDDSTEIKNNNPSDYYGLTNVSRTLSMATSRLGNFYHLIMIIVKMTYNDYNECG